MSLLVLAYPKIPDKDFKWIQNIRAVYDKRYYHVVNPHFTIVFPVSNILQPEFIEDIQISASESQKIIFTSRCTVIVKDSFSEFTDVFLVPDEGYSDIVKLHDKLYSGILKNELRLDIPFIPHIGIGGSINPLESKSIADELNKTNFSFEGILDKLDIVSYNYSEVKTLKEIKLL
jgi:2'-5' RNA ligase